MFSKLALEIRIIRRVKVAGEKQAIRRNENVQQTGNNNFNNSSITFDMSQDRLTPSDATKLLKLTQKLEKGSLHYSKALPADFQDKLDFNKVIRYKSIYMGATNSEQMNIIEESVQDMVDSQPLIMRLAKLFADVLLIKDGKIVPGNGDSQLKIVEQKLNDSILNDSEFWKLGISIEVVDQFVIGLVSYGILICKILLNPNEVGD